MARLIKITADLEKKIQVMCNINNWKVSDTELQIMCVLVLYANTGALNIFGDDGKHIRSKAGNVSESSFNVMIHRLHKKGLIRKSGSMVTINPALIKLDSVDSILIEFKAPVTG